MKKPSKPFKARPKHKIRPTFYQKREVNALRQEILEELDDVWLERGPEKAS